MKILTVVTHAGKFHADDIFSVAALSIYLENSGQKMRLIRTLDPAWIKKADFVLDIGRVYNQKKNRFDHHQEKTAGKRPNGILYATFGLIWKKFGKEISGNKKVAEIVDRKLIAPLDAGDNGISIYKSLILEIKPVTIESYIGVEAAAILDLEKDKSRKEINRALDLRFKELVEIAKKIIKVYVLKAHNRLLAEISAKKIYKKSKDKRLIIMDEYNSFNFSEFPRALITVYPDSRSRWSAQAVRIKNEDIKSRIYFPKKWRGKIDEDLAKISKVKDARFCHNSGFLAVADSKEGAIALAKIALKTNNKS